MVVPQEYSLLNIEDDFLSLMDDSGEQREDIKVPEGDIGEEIKVRVQFLSSSKPLRNEVFGCVHASLCESLSVRWSIRTE